MEELFVERGFQSNLARAKRIKRNGKRAETQAETIVLYLTKSMKKIFGHGDTEKVMAVRGDN